MMRVLLLLCCSFAASSLNAADVTVLAAMGAADDEPAITEGLRQGGRLVGLDVQSGEQTKDLVASAASLGIQCAATNAACAIQLGGLAGSRFVIVGEVKGAALTVRRFDVAESREAGRVALPWTSATSTTSAKLAMVRLFKPELEVGRLFVDVDVVGATVMVDRVSRGTSPIAPIVLPPGSHEVYVTDIDHDSQTFRVDVAFDANVTLDVRLAPQHEGSSSTNDKRGTTKASLGDTEFRRVAVLQVVTRGFDPLAALISTEALIAELQKVDGLFVITPQDVTGVLGSAGAARLAQCIDDICYARALQPGQNIDEVVIVDVNAEDDQPLISARRIDVRSTEAIERANGTIRVGRNGRGIGREIDDIVRTLYPGEALIKGASWGIATDLDARYAPPPISVLVFVGTVAGTAVSAGTTVAAALAYQGASNDARALPGIILAAGSVVTAITLGATIIEAPFVDWAGYASANDELLTRYGYARQ